MQMNEEEAGALEARCPFVMDIQSAANIVGEQVRTIGREIVTGQQ